MMNVCENMGSFTRCGYDVMNCLSTKDVSFTEKLKSVAIMHLNLKQNKLMRLSEKSKNQPMNKDRYLHTKCSEVWS